MFWQIIAAALGGVILLGAAVKALPACWQFVKAVAKGPIVLERMYEEFSPNGGSSLRDAVDELSVGQNRILQWQDEHAAEDIARLTALSEETASIVLSTKETDAYLHTRMHDILNRITPIIGWATIHDRRLTAIEQRLKDSADADAVVAADLAASRRADATDGPAGEAADAYTRTPPTEEPT